MKTVYATHNFSVITWCTTWKYHGMNKKHGIKILFAVMGAPGFKGEEINNSVVSRVSGQLRNAGVISLCHLKVYLCINKTLKECETILFLFIGEV